MAEHRSTTPFLGKRGKTLHRSINSEKAKTTTCYVAKLDLKQHHAHHKENWGMTIATRPTSRIQMWHNITHKKPQQMTCSITFEFGTKLQACNMRKGRHLPALWVQYFRCTSVFPSKLCPSVCALVQYFRCTSVIPSKLCLSVRYI